MHCSLIGDVKSGKLSRRDFMQRMMASGWAPLAAEMLSHSARRRAQTNRTTSRPTRRRGALKILWWQADAAQSALRVGQDQDGRASSRAAGELGIGWRPVSDPRGRIRTSRTAALAKDGKSVTWKLKQGVRGMTASHSQPTTSCSYGNTPPTPQRRRHQRHLQDIRSRR